MKKLKIFILLIFLSCASIPKKIIEPNKEVNLVEIKEKVFELKEETKSGVKTVMDKVKDVLIGFFEKIKSIFKKRSLKK